MAIEEFVKKVRKPSRYVGEEYGSIKKPWARIKIALAYPDLYEIGMSYLGLRILYFLINKHPEAAAERVFMPDGDMFILMKEKGIPLFSLETRTPLEKFDLVAFSLLYELNYTNVLHMLDLGGIPIKREERTGKYPLIGAGGPNVINPEPMSDFFDFFFFGDGEIFFSKAIPIFLKTKDRTERLQALSEIEGVYIPNPSLREKTEAGYFYIKGVKIKKAILKNLDEFAFPEDAILPHVESVFDREGWEISRGCPQKCRFCQATQFYSPFRARSIEDIANSVIRSLRKTGYDQVSFSSLSTADFPHFHTLISTLYPELKKWEISISLPSLRPSILQDRSILQIISNLRKTSFTIVPEAGTERLRRVINKATTHEEILQAARIAFELGWRRLKFYFMIGLPTEEEQDLKAIAELLFEISDMGKKILGSKPKITASISNFVPMPWTAFQWEKFEDIDILKEKQKYILGLIKRKKNIKINFHKTERSLLEVFLARGDFRAGKIIEAVYRRGGKLEAWNEHFNFSLWEEAAWQEALPLREFASSFPLDLPLPWDHMEAGPIKEYLLKERERAFKGERTPSCLELLCGRCKGCIYWKIAGKKFPSKIELHEKLPDRREEGKFIYRIFYTKKGIAKFLSQSELLKTIERIFRRTFTPLAFSKGFHPKPRISMGPALPVGIEGEHEVMEIETVEEIGEEFLNAWNENSINGLLFLSLDKTDEKITPKLKFALYWAPKEEKEKLIELGFLPHEREEGVIFIHDLTTPSPHRRAKERGINLKFKRLSLYTEFHSQI